MSSSHAEVNVCRCRGVTEDQLEETSTVERWKEAEEDVEGEGEEEERGIDIQLYGR